MPRWLVAPVVVLALIGRSVTAADPPVRCDPAAVDRLVGGSLKRWEAPGVAVAIVRGGETVHLKGYGTKRLGADDPVTPDTLFPLASCTKAFTSTLTGDAGRRRQARLGRPGPQAPAGLPPLRPARRRPASRCGTC